MLQLYFPKWAVAAFTETSSLSPCCCLYFFVALSPKQPVCPALMTTCLFSQSRAPTTNIPGHHILQYQPILLPVSNIDRLAAISCQNLKRDNLVLREKHCQKFSLGAKFLSQTVSFSFCLAFLRRLRELVCTLRDADMLSFECLLVFISNRGWLAFCIYNACSLWGCYRCHRSTPYQSFLVDIHTNIIVLP